MKKKISVLLLGGVLAAGSLFMKAPAAGQVRAEETKETAEADTNPCRKTESHLKSHELTAGNGQITVTFSCVEFEHEPECLYVDVWFFLSDKENANLKDFVTDEIDKKVGVLNRTPYDSQSCIRCSDYETTCTFTGLTNGETYYIYANAVFQHKDDTVQYETDYGVHDMILIGSCTPVAGAGNTSSCGTSGTSSSGQSGSKVSGYKAYENRVTGQIEEAQSGSTIVMRKGVTTLSNAVMQELVKKGDVSLRLEFTYQDEAYVIIIPAGAALDNDIPWYGPLYLAEKFGNSAKAKAAPAAGGTYTVQSGDSLSKIAAKNNMTLSELLEKNPQIKNTNKISVGQNINL